MCSVDADEPKSRLRITSGKVFSSHTKTAAPLCVTRLLGPAVLPPLWWVEWIFCCFVLIGLESAGRFRETAAAACFVATSAAAAACSRFAFSNRSRSCSAEVAASNLARAASASLASSANRFSANRTLSCSAAASSSAALRLVSAAAFTSNRIRSWSSASVLARAASLALSASRFSSANRTFSCSAAASSSAALGLVSAASIDLPAPTAAARDQSPGAADNSPSRAAAWSWCVSHPSPLRHHE
mmetsp:Transcript_23957/g.64806  ORF Transcript_23957/g.64806 Transcript_23957/m.64806 type:complete len:243 (+) Transcript_23957:548-1276(+)